MKTYIAPQHKILMHPDRLLHLQNGRHAPPVNVEIDLSNRCSLGCEWCHFAYTHTRGPLAGTTKPDGASGGGDLFNTELLIDIGQQLAAAGVLSTTWTGGGEPTLHPDFDRIVNAWPLAQGLYTHGGHIDAARVQLLKRRLAWVYVSLDECTPEAYRQSKGVDRFGQAVDGAARLAEAAGPATVGVGYILHAGNYRQVFDMVGLALDEIGADYVQFRPAVRYHQDRPGELAESTAWIDDALIYLRRVAGQPRVYAEPERFTIYRDWDGHGYDTCYWSALQTVITPDGRVWTCVNRREYPGAELGDLSRESFTAVWSRHKACQVGPQCRVLCRGHMANLTLDHVLHGLGHREFI